METNSQLSEKALFNLPKKFTPEQSQNAWLLSAIINKSPSAEFWQVQEKLTLAERMQVYPLLVLDAKVNKEISEQDLIVSQLQAYYPLLNLAQTNLSLHNISSYIKFLEERLHKVGEKQLDSTINELSKLPLKLKKTEAVAFLVYIFTNPDILEEDVTDYWLASFIQNNFLFDNSQSMKFILQEISKLRRMEYDTPKFEEAIVKLLVKCKIRIK